MRWISASAMALAVIGVRPAKADEPRRSDKVSDIVAGAEKPTESMSDELSESAEEAPAPTPAQNDGSQPVEDSERPRNAITFEPLAVVFARAFAIEYERLVAERWSLHLQPAIVFGASRLAGAADDPEAVDRGFSGYGLAFTAGMRFFPFEAGLEGFFTSLFVSIGWATQNGAEGASDTESWGYGVGLMVGWTFILGGIFDLSLGAGATWQETHHGEPEEIERGIEPALRLGVGAAF